jgi:uncharacterized protein YneF (UPF0154 family)
VIDIPLGVLVLFMLFMFLLAGMAYEQYIRPKLFMRSLKIKPQRKQHLLIKT